MPSSPAQAGDSAAHAAERLAGEGAAVVVVDIDGANAQQVARAIGNGSIAVQADVSSETDVQRYCGRRRCRRSARSTTTTSTPGIFGTFAPLPERAVRGFRPRDGRQRPGQFLGLRAAFRQYAAQGTTGAVVLTASIASLTGSADLLPYLTSKHAVVGLIHGAAMYGGPLGVRVNGVAPGIVPTDLFAAAGNTTGGANDMSGRAKTTPLRRAGQPEEIAAVAAFLLSDDASYMTGQVLSADGGASIVNTVRPSGGAGAWDYASVDRNLYGATINGVTQ